MKSFVGPLWAALLLGALFCGCGQTQPEPVLSSNMEETEPMTKPQTQGRHFRIALAEWCNSGFGAELDIAKQCVLAKRLDADLDLVPYDQWGAVKEAGVAMSCVLPDMGDMPPFVPGFNDPAHCERVRGAISLALDRASEYDVPFVIVFTGMATKGDRDEQFRLIVEGFTKPGDGERESLVTKAERLGVTLIIEQLNTQGEEKTWRGHPGYLGTSVSELVEKVIVPIGSTHFRLAFDVYHVVMEGLDPLAMIEKHHGHIAYVHAAGVMRQEGGHHPKNRGELHLAGQVVDYPAVMAALAKYVPEGTYCLLEYIPNEQDPAAVEANLAAAIQLCESKVK